MKSGCAVTPWGARHYTQEAPSRSAGMVPVLVASIAAGAISVIYNPIMLAPVLGPEGIGVLGVFLSLVYVLSFPQRPLNFVLIRVVSQGNAGGGTPAVRGMLSR